MKPFRQILIFIAFNMGYLTTSSCAQQNSTTEPYAVFVASTPCHEGVRPLHNIPADADCDLIKWKLTLYQDAAASLPATYELERTFHRESTIKGTWAILRGTQFNPDAVIYQLDPDKPEQSLLLMKGDENVLFFLDKDRNYLLGNNDFSYTLNRKKLDE